MFGKLFFTSFTIFFTEFKELMPLVISFVPAWIMMQSGLSTTKFSISSNTFSVVPPGKFLTVTWWSLDSPLSLIPLRSESPVTKTFFFLFNLIVCASSLGISDSILSLRGLLFVLLLSWLWFYRGIVKAFFTDNCPVKKLIISPFFEISFSSWEFCFWISQIQNNHLCYRLPSNHTIAADRKSQHVY